MLMWLSGCMVSHRVPQAEITVFELQVIDTVYRYGGDRYVYTWFEKYNKVTYLVYLKEPLDVTLGQTMVGLIRR